LQNAFLKQARTGREETFVGEAKKASFFSCRLVLVRWILGEILTLFCGEKLKVKV
jgi:hypothetical protein